MVGALKHKVSGTFEDVLGGTSADHSARHASGGADELTPADIGAAEDDHTHTTITPNTQTSSYTLALTDAGQAVEMNSTSDTIITVPRNATVAFPVGTVIELCQLGTGQVSIIEDTAVTVRQRNGNKLAGQYASASLRKRATDEWVLAGDLKT